LKKLDHIELDITESRQEEAKISKVLQEWQITFDATNDAMWILNKDQRILRSNKTAERIFKRTNKELIGKHCWEIVHGSTQPILECPIRRAKKSLHRESMELQIGKGWFEIIVDPILDAFGQYDGAVHIVSDITERKRAEDTLKESREHYHSLYNNTPAMLHSIDIQGNLISVSEYWLSALGYARNEVLGRKSSDFLTDASRKYANEIVLPEFFKTGYCNNIEYQYVKKNGEVINCLLSAISERNESGEVVRSLAVITDITERKLAEKKLQESEERFRRIFEDHAAVKLLIDPDSGEIIDANKSAAVYYGWSREELKRMKIEQINILTPEEVKLEMEKARFQNRIQFEFKHRRKDGSIRDVEVFSSNILIGNKDVLHSIVHDTTERKLAEEALRESEERFRHSFEYAAVGVCIVGIDLKFQRVNNAFIVMIGYQEDELKKFSFNDITHPDDLSFGLDQAKIMLSGKADNASFEKRYIRKDRQTIWVHISISLVKNVNNQPQFFIVQTIDITERKQMEEGLRNVQKLEGLGTLAGGIAHDFNNILGIILAYNASIKKFKDDSKKLDLAIETISKTVDRGKTLVQQILTFARKTETSFGSVNVNDVVMEILSMIYEMFPKTVNCSQNFDKMIPYINADRSQLHQVLMNLCVNARDAMPSGGVLYIKTRMESVAALRNQHPDADASAYVCIEVSDTGEGMTEETRKRIYEPFFTTKGIGKGTGLGLAVVFGVVQTHKGFIHVESEVGKGTTFCLYLPASQAAPHAKVVEKEETLEEMQGGTETLFIVEDEEMLAMPLQMALNDKGYKVIYARDGFTALNIYQEKKDEIDLVITDLGLPHISGLDVCSKIKQINPKERIILATGFLDPEIRAEFLKAGVRHFLYKPYDLSKVLKVIREVLDEK
jgi:PAS domain S-box-containing protein